MVATMPNAQSSRIGRALLVIAHLIAAGVLIGLAHSFMDHDLYARHLVVETAPYFLGPLLLALPGIFLLGNGRAAWAVPLCAHSVFFVAEVVGLVLVSRWGMQNIRGTLPQVAFVITLIYSALIGLCLLISSWTLAYLASARRRMRIQTQRLTPRWAVFALFALLCGMAVVSWLSHFDDRGALATHSDASGAG